MEQKLQLTGKVLWLRDNGEYRFFQEVYIYAWAFSGFLEKMPLYARAWSRLNLGELIVSSDLGTV